MKNRNQFNFVVYVLPFLALFSALVVFGTPSDTEDALVGADTVNGNTAYQYRIAAATTDWYSHVIDVRGKSFVAMSIFEATGSTAADLTGTVGTGDFYLKGKAGGTGTNQTDDGIDPSGYATGFVFPYHYGPMVGQDVSGYIAGTTAIDLYGMTLYDVRGLTHVFVSVTTNNTDTSVALAVE